MKVRTAPILVVTITACASVGCGKSTGSDACTKAEECCGKVQGACDDINKEGEGFEKRCEIDFNAKIDTLKSYDHDSCNAIADAFQDLIDCFAGISCDEISMDEEVPTCNDVAKAYCIAKQNSGADVCGKDYSDLSCDDVVAEADDMRKF